MTPKEQLTTALKDIIRNAKSLLDNVEAADTDLKLRLTSALGANLVNSSYWDLKRACEDLDIVGYVVRLKTEQNLSLPCSCSNVIEAFKEQFPYTPDGSYWTRFKIPAGTLGLVVGLEGAYVSLGLFNKKQGKIFSKNRLSVSTTEIDVNVSADEARELTKAKTKYLVRKGYDNFDVVKQLSKTKGVTNEENPAGE